MQVEAAELGLSSFVTLTYSDEFLPTVHHPETDTWIPTLEKSHAKNWIRSVRRKAMHLGLPKRFFMAGEYGTKTGRPHYHVILFGIGPSWKRDFEPLWKYGFQSWYPASARAMAYVAKYCLKTGGDPELRLPTSRPQDDEALTRVTVPPFRRMSRNPAIGTASAKKVAASIGKPSTVMAMLEQEKQLKGVIQVGPDRYPMGRTVRDYLDKELESRYGLDTRTRDRMLQREPHAPSEEEIERARNSHIRAWQKRNTRNKL